MPCWNVGTRRAVPIAIGIQHLVAITVAKQ